MRINSSEVQRRESYPFIQSRFVHDLLKSHRSSRRCSMRSMQARMAPLGFLFCLLLTGLTLAVQPFSVGAENQTASFRLVSPAPVQSLDIEQTSSGPVVNGLFGRFASSVQPLADKCGSQVGCGLGSHAGPNACCDEFSKSQTVFCNNYGCNGGTCVGSVKPTCCASGCIEDYPPSCVGCILNGYCH